MVKLLRYLFYPIKNLDRKGEYFSKRELSVTLLSDTCLRYLSYENETDFKQGIVKLNPAKIDIGAVYSAKPSEKKSLNAAMFKPLEKEMVIDIDLTDYDDVRNCCSEANICDKCWSFIVVAVKIIDRALEDDFGFNHKIWVYSGRRGIHCWICDKRARKLTQQARKALISYLEIVKGGSEMKKKVSIGPNPHPCIMEASKILESYFVESIVVGQDILGNGKDWAKVLNGISSDSLSRKVKEELSSCDATSKERWAKLTKMVDSTIQREIVFQLMYPRLDVNVSIGLNHLLKSPFCVHPKTGRVCVPVMDIDQFKPTDAPTIEGLLNELDSALEVNESARDMKTTSLYPYLDFFNAFLRGLATETSNTDNEMF